MKKRALSLALAGLLALSQGIGVSAKKEEEVKKNAQDMTYEEYIANVPAIHTFMNRPIEPIPEELYKVDSKGGTLVPQPCFDLSSKDNKFDILGLGMEYGEVKGKGYHRITVADPTGNKYCRGDKFEIKPNRTYLVSVLVWADFSRIHENTTREANVGLYFYDENGNIALGRRYGIPDYTDGWTRIEFTINSGTLENAKYAQPQFILSGFFENAPASNILFADLKIYELPTTEITPYKEGEGVTFRGSQGGLDMHIEDVVNENNLITVDTTGARYIFDTLNDTITAEQRINLKRKVSTWKSSISLKELKIKKKNDKEVVITNPEISFGVQMDGNLFLTPHQNDVNLLCTSEIGGQWNRYGSGCLLSFDDYGGFSVAPDIPLGSGRMPRSRVITEDLDFAKIPFENNIANRNPERDILISNEKPGWQIEWTISPGERLCIGTFPPREYDYETAFKSLYRNVYPAPTHLENMPIYAEEYKLGIAQLWSFCHMTTAGMQWGPYYQHDKNEQIMVEMVKAAHNNGIKALDYTTAHFYYDRSSPDMYVQEVRRLRDRYGIDGVYTDGTPGDGGWVVGYEQARMVRELFPDGAMIAHQTGQPNNGGAPVSSPAIFLPNMDTYYDITLKGENVPIGELNAPLPYMTWPQRGLANCVGVSKADNWIYTNDIGESVKLNLTEAALINIANGGLPRLDDGNDNWKNITLPVITALEENWKQYGEEKDYFEKHYAPLARKLTHQYLSKFGSITIMNEGFDNEENLLTYEKANIVTQLVKNKEGNALRILGTRTHDNGSLFKRTMSLSGEMSVSFDVKIDEAADYEYKLFNDYGKEGITLRFSYDNKLMLKTASGGYSVVSSFSRNKWHSIRLEVNTDKHKLNIIVDGVKLVSGMDIDDELYYLGNHEFTTGGYGSSMCIDNFKADFSY